MQVRQASLYSLDQSDSARWHTRSLLGVYHQGMGTSPASVSASLACLGPKAAAMACLGTARAALLSLPAMLCAESAGLSKRPLLLSAVVGRSCMLLDASRSLAMVQLAPVLPYQCCSCHMRGEGEVVKNVQ